MVDDPTSAEFWLRELMEDAEEVGSSASHAMRTRQALFLASLARTNTPTQGAAAAGVTVSTTYKWGSEDPIFSRAKQWAVEAYADRLIAEGTRRAVEGCVVAIRDRHGEVVGEERKFSDPLLAFMLRGLDKQQRWARREQGVTSTAEAWRTTLKAVLADPEAAKMFDELSDRMAGA